MANYDKYDPKAGGFRAPLAADWHDPADFKEVFGVGLNASGQVVKGTGNSGFVGIMILTRKQDAGDIVDIMTNGEVVDFPGTAGTKYYAAAADGVVNATSAAGKLQIGWTVQADRLVVRTTGGAVAA